MPLLGEVEHPSENLQLAVDAGNLKSVLPSLGYEAGDLLGGDLVKRFLGQLVVREEALHAVLIVSLSLAAGRERRGHKGKKIAGGELPKGLRRRSVANADLAFCERGLLIPRRWEQTRMSRALKMERGRGFTRWT